MDIKLIEAFIKDAKRRHNERIDRWKKDPVIKDVLSQPPKKVEKLD